MNDNKNSAMQKRADFKKRMMAQSKLPQIESDDKKVVNRSAYSPFEAWTHYTKKK